ncbi:MAG: 16S rRNA (adenine(1518)-N(6)/adenine(1519)-N(6))-dimethyltransferase RsmA [Thermoproteota archaeon]|nr:16S rRNA (adenine(1518)-N(6)/adenine(1519)-N(6))-dimethyltransferase RsmA [Thermoproteota archaeon]
MPRNSITRALGQHMLVDMRILDKIVSAAHIDKEEIVLEVGTGEGILTAELCKYAKRVISYEIDTKLYRKAQKQLSSQFKNLELINADLFKINDSHFFNVFVSNLPYSRSRDAIEWLFTQEFDRAILMVQKEFADKLAATPGSKNYRAISALAAHCFAIEKLFKVRRESFEPQPKVESLVIGITPVHLVTREVMRNINLLFSRRNKKASSVAAELGTIVDANYGNKKIDQLEPRHLIRMAELISSPNVCPI